MGAYARLGMPALAPVPKTFRFNKPQAIKLKAICKRREKTKRTTQLRASLKKYSELRIHGFVATKVPEFEHFRFERIALCSATYPARFTARVANQVCGCHP
jgi:hypothetical protein